MLVIDAHDGLTVLPDNLYVLPPDAVMTVCNGVLCLKGGQEGVGEALSINRFFGALAVDQSALAVGEVLSGNASDDG